MVLFVLHPADGQLTRYSCVGVHSVFGITSVMYLIITSCFLFDVHFRFQPTQEEREMYKKYAGDKSQLPLADTFLLKVYMYIVTPCSFGIVSPVPRPFEVGRTFFSLPLKWPGNEARLE